MSIYRARIAAYFERQARMLAVASGALAADIAETESGVEVRQSLNALFVSHTDTVSTSTESALAQQSALPQVIEALQRGLDDIIAQGVA